MYHHDAQHTARAFQNSIKAFSLDSQNRPTLALNTETNADYIVQSSPDPFHWTDLAGLHTSATTSTFTGTNSTSGPSKFYRTVVLPPLPPADNPPTGNSSGNGRNPTIP